MSSKLFQPLAIGPVEVPNRIVVAPMCQYSAHDGCADPDWHGQHLMNLAMSGSGLVMLEATGVERRGRISHHCLGLWSDENEAALARVLAAARRVALPGTRFGIQLGHSGRKGSAQRPWEGGRPLARANDPWETVAPSALPFADGWPAPRALQRADLDAITAAFVAAATRCVRLGLEVIELHMAHGYLLHQFLSPISNRREDDYGGSAEARMRFPLEVARAVRSVLPASTAFGARITGTDWLPDGIGPSDAVVLARALKAIGTDYVCVTSGALVLGLQIPLAPGYQVPFARQVKAEAGITTRAVGLIVDPEHAESIVASGDADCVALARALIDDPRWPWHAAQRLHAEIAYPPAYDRVRPATWPGAAILRKV